MTQTYYEVHGEQDGHVSGSYDRDYAEELVDHYNDEMEQDHFIKERIEQ